ncbi:MAG: hypothetical protein ACYCQI_04425 [Gammaproteobacteria bacterium]
MFRKSQETQEKKDPLVVFAKNSKPTSETNPAKKEADKKSWFSLPSFFSKDKEKLTAKVVPEVNPEPKKERVTLEGELAKLQAKKAKNPTSFVKSLMPKTEKEKKAEERKADPDTRARIDKAMKQTQKKGRFRF